MTSAESQECPEVSSVGRQGMWRVAALMLQTLEPSPNRASQFKRGDCFWRNLGLRWPAQFPLIWRQAGGLSVESPNNENCFSKICRAKANAGSVAGIPGCSN